VERALALSESKQAGLRSTAAWAMGKIGSPAFIDRLTALLRDAHTEVRSTAIRSLVEIGRAEGARRAEVTASEPPTETQPAAADTVADTMEPETPAPYFEITLDGSYKPGRR
jgi:HEAT repeat protein